MPMRRLHLGVSRAGRGAAEAVPGYRGLEPVGRGGFSTVYRARQVALDRVVALKVLDVDVDDPAVERRFLREVRLTSALTGHPHVVTVLDAGLTGRGEPYLTMEYFERGSLQERLAASGPLPVAEVLDIGVKIAGALEAAHRAGILHRDVKPQNILVSRFGEPALADFGIARLVVGVEPHTLVQALTPYHVAPEVLEGAEATAATDVYGLGSTLYQLLAGRPAFQRAGQDVAQLLLRIISEPWPEPARSDAPPALLAAIKRAMARRPEDRFASCATFAEALLDAAAGTGAMSTGPEAARSAAGAPATATGATAAGAPTTTVENNSAPDRSAATRGQGPDPAFSPWAPRPARTTRELESPRARTVPVAPSAPATSLPSAFDGLPEAALLEEAQTEEALEATSLRPGRPAVQAVPETAVRGRRRRLILVSGAAFLVLAAAGTARLLLSLGSGHASGGGRTAVTAPTRASGYPPAQIAAARPGSLTVRDLGDSVSLTWKQGSAADVPMVVQVSVVPASGAPQLHPVDTGATSAMVTGLSSVAQYCFTVGAVIGFGDPDVIAWSAPSCIRGASAAVTG